MNINRREETTKVVTIGLRVVFFKVANNMNPNQTAPLGAV